MSSPVVSSRTPVGQIISPDGTATFAFLKWMQNIGATVNIGFDSEGNYQGAIGDQATIDGRETLASIVQNISTDGVVQGPGIDFALPYLNKDTDHIADGTGSPLAGGKVAYAALVASGPAAGQTIRFNGTTWLPVAIAISKVLATSQWLRSYDAVTGTFTASQPGFSDVSGVATKVQLPPAIAYEDEANIFTADQTINGALAVTGNATVGGDLGVTGNISAANFPGPSSMVYPAAGIGVSTGSAWAASIDPATVQGKLTLTTTGTSGASTLVGNTLNIPTYTAPSQVYPGAGLAVSTGTAWGTSINPATLATYPGAGIAVSTGTAWGTPIAPATIPRLNANSGLDVVDIISSGSNIRMGPRFPVGGPGVWGSGSANINAQGGMFINAGAGANSVTFNWDQGTGGVVFGNGASVAAAAITSAGELTCATLAVSGTKSFVVPHPLDETKVLIHSCLEGPENGVFYRGRAKTDDLGYVTVLLPDYFEALTYLEDRSVLLTVINDGSDKFPILKSSEVSAGGFSIRSSIPETEFYWEVKAVRRIGVERLQVAQDKA